ncbi:MAG: hypothetical protein Q7T25_11970 [Sideroxyarcus sp.]|nr:hypothetical protein [Sideroxyarcus sp.]
MIDSRDVPAAVSPLAVIDASAASTSSIVLADVSLACVILAFAVIVPPLAAVSD